MSLTPALAAKTLGGLAVTSATCCGSYYAYDSSYPPFHNKMEKDGFLWSTIDETSRTAVSLGKNKKETLKELEKDWRCSKYLFGEFETPSIDTSTKEKKSSGTYTIPTFSNSNNAKTNEPIACLIVDLKYSKDSSKNGAFIKWELALRSGSRGFIYIGFAGFGAIKPESGSGNSNTYVANTSSSMVFDISKKVDKWEIGNGFSWADVFSKDNSLSADSTSSVLISLPNKEYEWKKESGNTCVDTNCDLNNWEHKEWIGFWEEGPGDKQPTDALDIQIKKTSSQGYEKHDIWRTTDFGFENSNQNNSKAWTSYVEAWYDGASKKWKDMNSTGNAQTYLTASYSPWAKKKGSWTKASETCSKSYSRHLNQKETNRLTKFCYKKK